MPTYFGPTNLPPLEAWMMGKPLIYSTSGREQAGDAALLFDPDDANELATALKWTRDDHLCTDLIEKGHKRLLDIEAQRNIAEEKLLDRLMRFEKRCRCWGEDTRNASYFSRTIHHPIYRPSG
jgi:glycosyltransferase involved in cell wall biosynthesis